MKPTTFGFATRPATITITLEPFARWLPQLAKAVAAVCEVNERELVMRQQKSRRIKQARLVFTWAARETLRRSYPEIADALGCQCRNSAVAGHRIARGLRNTDPEFRQLSDLVVAIAAQLVRRDPQQLRIQQEMFHDAQTA